MELSPEKILALNPGDPVFAEFADELRLEGQCQKALQVCLSGLNANPDCHLGRLALAQVFYQLGYISFASREIKELLCRCPDLVSLQKLLKILEPDAEIKPLKKEGAGQTGISEDDTVAEAEFDLDDLELIKADREKKQ